MSDGTINIRCPRCGHAYAMTRLQIDVYRGRQMGCMACGRPFPVVAPPEPADEPASLGYESAGQQVTVANEPGDQRVIEGGEPSPATSSSPTETTAATADRETPVPTAPPTGPTLWDRAGVAAGLAFFVACAAAAVVGYAAAPAKGPHTAPTGGPAVVLAAVVAPACALAALALGAGRWWHLKRPRTKGEKSGRPRSARYAFAAVGLGSVELAMAGLLAVVAWPPVARGLEDNRRAICQTRLQQVGHTLLAAASMPRADGRFPDALSDLPGTTGISPETLVCPADHDHPAASGSYRYLGKGLSARAGTPNFAGPTTVLAYERPGLHPDGFHVLFADRTVVFVEKAEAEAMARELEAGQNPPPSAQAVRAK